MQKQRQPEPPLTLTRFVYERFIPDRVALRKPSTRSYYDTILHTLCAGVPPAPIRSKLRDHSPVGRVPTVRSHGLGSLALADVSPEDVQGIVNVLLVRGYSVAMAKKVANAAHLVFGYAQRLRLYPAVNPAEGCCFPEAQPVHERHALTVDQLRRLLQYLGQHAGPPYRAMVLTAALTGLNVAELCGLRWQSVNLTDEPRMLGAATLPAHSLRVAEQYSQHYGYGTPKTRSRRRTVVLCGAVVEALRALRTAVDHPEAPVFAYPAGSTAVGRPINAKSALENVLKPAGAACGMPWLTWHDLRRTFATLTDAAGMTPAQRQALLGHASAAMTQHYSLPDGEAMRAALESLGASL